MSGGLNLVISKTIVWHSTPFGCSDCSSLRVASSKHRMISRSSGGEAVGGPAFIQVVKEYPQPILESEIAFDLASQLADVVALLRRIKTSVAQPCLFHARYDACLGVYVEGELEYVDRSACVRRGCGLQRCEFLWRGKDAIELLGILVGLVPKGVENSDAPQFALVRRHCFVLYQDDAFIAADGIADFVGDVEVRAADISDETLARSNTVEDRFDDEPTGNIVFAPRGEIIPPCRPAYIASAPSMV